MGWRNPAIGVRPEPNTGFNVTLDHFQEGERSLPARAVLRKLGEILKANNRSLDSLVGPADVALYRAEQLGRNRVEIDALQECSAK